MTDSEIEELLGQLNAFPLGMSEHDDFRLSIAGAQQKTALTKLPDIGWVLPSGTMPTTHIFKTPIGSLLANSIHFDESCENEWLCLEIARAFGLPAANADILTFGCRTAIVVERFDRAISRRQNDHLLRIPTEDFCQVFGISPEKKYEADGGPGIRDIMDVLKWSADADGDRRRFMAAQVLLWLLDSTDGHAKNYSVFLEAKDRFRLTPLYDILSAAPLAATGELSSRRLKLAMGLIGKNRHYRMTDIEPRHFLSTAAAVDYPKAEMLAVLNHFERLFRYFAVDALAFVVAFVDLLPDFHSALYVGCGEKLHRIAPRIHAAGGVDARPYLEHDVVDGDMPGIDLAEVYEGQKAVAGGGVELLEPEVGENAVLSDHAHEIRGDAYHQQIEQGSQAFEGDSVFH